MFEWVKSLDTHLAPSGAPWDSLSVPINKLHPEYIISVIVHRSLRVDADDEREKLALETIGI
jgi:hypothetical protein